MNWLIWRQHGKQFVFSGVAILVYVAIVLTVGVHTAHAYRNSLNDHQTYFNLSGAVRYMPLTTIVLPLLFGMFWGAPLIAKEYEIGTNKLVWTQSVTRRKWLTAKLGWMLGFAAFYGAIVSLAVGWTLRTENAIMFDRFE